MRSLFRSRIFRRQFLSFLGLSFLFFGSISLVLMLRTSRAVVARQMEVSSAYCDQISQHVLDWMRERLMDVRYLSVELEDEGPGALQSSMAEGRLSAFMEVANGIRSAAVIDINGRVVASSSGPSFEGRDLLDREYAREAISGRVFMSSVFEGRTSGQPTMAIAVPLRLPGGGRGAVIGFLPVSELLRTVKSSSLQNLGEVYLVDRSGMPLDPSVAGVPIPSGQAGAASTPLIPTDLLQRGSGAAEYRKPDGSWAIGAYHRLEGLNLGLVVELSRSLAMKPVTSLMGFVITVAIVMLVLLIVISYILSMIIIEPLGELIVGAEALRLGKASEPIRVRTGTEIDQLAELFNSMAESVREREERLRDNAVRDSLTGLYNHGRFEEFLELEIRRRRRTGEPVSLAMLDIDHFKLVNDEHGHLAGDAVLREIAGILTQAVRGSDVVARYGGEEFAVILDAKSEEEVAAFCERIRSLVEASSFEEAGPGLRITASLGWTRCSARDQSPADVVRLADRALYEAKNAGRNRVFGGTS
ncbi:MAG TPA: diguanylate cyclase [Rectinemataceae bacterium]|nr:diguanylate cyclase [Rectinemataceae bacterium]